MEMDEQGFTALAAQAAGKAGRYAGDDMVRPVFEVRPKLNQDKSKEAGRPIFDDVVFITIYTPGNKDNIPCRPVNDFDRARFRKQYDAFMETMSNEPQEGTPLAEWPAVTRGQVEELKFFNILTVEQLAGAPDTALQSMIGASSLKVKAAEFIKGLDKKDAEIADLKARLAKLEAAADSEDEDAPPRRRRGRPAKEELEA